jgi:site-specific recombinase XerD
VESRATGLHLFRHTAGSLLNKKTADLKRVQVQLVHADSGTTAECTRMWIWRRSIKTLRI